MASYDQWNKLDDEDDEELQDSSIFEGKKDVILFCIDCSPSMLELYEDPVYENVQTCHLLTALDAAMQIQKKKVIVGPNDAVGIVLFNTSKKNDSSEDTTEIKDGTYLYQAIDTVNAPKIQELSQLIDSAREDSTVLNEMFPPTERRVPMGDVFTSCNWIIRDGAPKTATKRVFLITDEDDPHPGPASERLLTSSRTTLLDLTQAGTRVEPFFISTEEKPFELSKFYYSVLSPSNLIDDDDLDPDGPSSVLPESISISRIDDLLDQMRFHEVPKRALFSVPFELAKGFVIGVKGYGLITEQKKGMYRYFADLGDRMEVATARTSYVDEEREKEVDRDRLLYGMDLGMTAADGDDDAGENVGIEPVRKVPKGRRVFYTAEEVRSFRTLGLEPIIRLLGFKKRKELAFEDNVKHSTFIYPDEMRYSGSKRTFSALLKTMIKKRRIGIALALFRRNSSPIFCAMLPQAETVEDDGWHKPPGFHLVPFPFADDIRAAPIDESLRASEKLTEAARVVVNELNVKSGYLPDSFPNPALAFHNAQLEASAFREEFDPEAFEDLTRPNYDGMHKRAGKYMKAWKEVLVEDESANTVIITTGSKRKADLSVDEAEIRSKHEVGMLGKLRVDQLKDFLKSKSLPVSGKKAELVERVGDWLDNHSNTNKTRLRDTTILGGPITGQESSFVL